MLRFSLTEARKRLPALARQAEYGASIEITNRGRVVARLVAPANDVATTADVLLDLRAALPRRRARSSSAVSTNKNASLTRTRR